MGVLTFYSVRHIKYPIYTFFASVQTTEKIIEFSDELKTYEAAITTYRHTEQKTLRRPTAWRVRQMGRRFPRPRWAQQTSWAPPRGTPGGHTATAKVPSLSHRDR